VVTIGEKPSEETKTAQEIMQQTMERLNTIKGIHVMKRADMQKFLQEHPNALDRVQQAVFGIDDRYLNSDYFDVIPELKKVVKRNKYNKAGTDAVILESTPQNIYLIDHSSQKEFEVHKKEGRHGVGIRKVYKLNELTENDLKEIIRNISPSYDYSETRIRHILQTLGIEEEHLSGIDLPAELKRIANSNDEIYGKEGQGAHTGGYGSGRYNYNVRQGGNRTKGSLGQNGETQLAIDLTTIVGNSLYRELSQADKAHQETVKELNRINELLYRQKTYESSMQTSSGEIKISQSTTDKDEDRIQISSGKSIFDRVNMSIIANTDKNLIGGSIILPAKQILEKDKNYNRLHNPIRTNHIGMLKAVLEHFIKNGHKRPASKFQWFFTNYGYKRNIATLSEILGVDVSPYFQYELSQPIDTIDQNGKHVKRFKERVIVDAEGLLKVLPTLQDTKLYNEVKKAIEFNEQDTTNYELQREILTNQYKALKEKADKQWDEIQRIKKEIQKEADNMSNLPFFLTPQGEVYGFVDKDGNIYLDETVITPEHPIHEYTHLWDRAVEKLNPKFWKTGVNIFKKTFLWNEILNDENYGKRWQATEDMTPERLENLIASEVHARLTGKRGKELLEQIAKDKGSKGIIGKLKQWLLDFWKTIKGAFTPWTDDQLKRLNDLAEKDLDKALKYLSDMTLKDFTEGVNPMTQQPVQQDISKDNTALTQFKKDVNLLAGYYEGGGRHLRDDLPAITDELNMKLANHFLGGKELSTEDYRKLWKLLEFYNTENGERAFRPKQQIAQQPNQQQIQGENIASNGSEFAKKLANPGNNLQVEYKGKTFRNAEHAYQTWKSGEFDEAAYNSNAFKPRGIKPVNKQTNYQTMVDILKAKLQQHPELIEGITQRGGEAYLKASTHQVTGDTYWESTGQNKFIEALTEAYNTINSDNNRSINEEEQVITVAPYFRQPLTTSNKGELEKATQEVRQKAEKLAKIIGLEISDIKVVGGTYQGKSEITYQYRINSTDQQKIDLFASLMGDLSFEYQDAVIAANYIEKEKWDSIQDDKAIEIVFKAPEGTTIEDVESMLSKASVDGSTYHFDNGILTITAFSEVDTINIVDRINKINEKNDKKYEYRKEETQFQNSRYLDNDRRRALYQTWLASPRGKENRQCYNACSKALAICEAAAKFPDVKDKEKHLEEQKAIEAERIKAAQQAAKDWDFSHQQQSPTPVSNILSNPDSQSSSTPHPVQMTNLAQVTGERLIQTDKAWKEESLQYLDRDLGQAIKQGNETWKQSILNQIEEIKHAVDRISLPNYEYMNDLSEPIMVDAEWKIVC
jgi:hypothetical protein